MAKVEITQNLLLQTIQTLGKRLEHSTSVPGNISKQGNNQGNDGAKQGQHNIFQIIDPLVQGVEAMVELLVLIVDPLVQGVEAMVELLVLIIYPLIQGCLTCLQYSKGFDDFPV